MNVGWNVCVVAISAAALCAVPAGGEGGDTMAGKDGPQVNVRFVYNFCGDLAATRRFYTELLGLDEAGYSEEHRYLCYQCEGFQLMFFRPDAEVPVKRGWADQPAYDGGSEYVASWSVEVPTEEFPATVARLREAGVECFAAEPDWRVDSYWGFTVKDPMGNTVEVYSAPKERPASTTWPGK
jgi:catechol 2,3-dioxygenase-like lactoylglutathione lyase family enzyme